MKSWDHAIVLPEGPGPIFLRIAQAIVEDIRRGRLRAGDPLPGYRTLAEQLKVSRNTALAAYHELLAEGWIHTQAGGGTFISDRPLGPSAPLPGVGPKGLGFALEGVAGPADGPPVPGVHLAAASGVPDPRLLPMTALTRAYRHALENLAQRPLGAADPKGQIRLRRALAGMLGSLRGLAAGPEELLVTRGSQMAIFLLAQALVRPGDRVAVEELGRRRVAEAFASCGASLVPLPVDAEGLSVEALEAELAKGPLRAVYLTPQHQYPTTVTLSEGRRARLLALAEQHRIALIEHDFDAEFHYDGPPVLPLASQDHAGTVIYVGSFSKIFSPTVRLGFVAGPKALVDRLAQLRVTVDSQGDPALELAMAELLEEGELQRHHQRMRQIYLARRNAFADVLRRTLGEAVTFEVPTGGMAFWLRTAPGIDVPAWSARALARGVTFRPGRDFHLTGSDLPHLRLGFSSIGEADVEELVRRMKAALETGV
ncbi:MAG TPA: PLP-dependent aminotransferase family protein [Holophagaceae bacterium]|nr:PLP-dependent aminotransferase family protein [Holophagaceae bacterium]